ARSFDVDEEANTGFDRDQHAASSARRKRRLCRAPSCQNAGSLLASTRRPAMSFDAFIESAWTNHGDDPEGVAQRLSESLGVIGKPADIPHFARLAVHVYGEHLAR